MKVRKLEGSQYFNETAELYEVTEDVLKRFKNDGKAKTFDEYTSFSPNTRISPYTNNLGLYSALEKAVGEMDFKMIPPKMLINRINSAQGVKAEELEWSGLIEWLETQEGKVSKAQVMDFIKAGGVKLEEIVKKDVKYDKYTLGAEPDNYREVLLTMPNKPAYTVRKTDRGYEVFVNGELVSNSLVLDTREKAQEMMELMYLSGTITPKNVSDTNFTSGHWSESNVLVHFRLQDMVSKDGKKTLLVEEIQSDWHQDGRKKGYSKPVDKEVEKKLEIINRKKDELYMKFQQFLHDNEYLGHDKLSDAMIGTWNKPKDFLIKHYGEIMPADIAAIPDEFNKLRSEGLEYHMQIADNKAGVPNAPFKNSDAWAMLAFKRILNMAVSEGYDSVSWTPGDIQAERYDLSKQVSNLVYTKDKDELMFWIGGRAREALTVTTDKLSDYVGKEIADKISKSTDNVVALSGLDLKVGGEGMKGFYDKILRDAVAKYVKKLDKNAKVTTKEIRTPEGNGGATRDELSAAGYDSNPVTLEHLEDGKVRVVNNVTGEVVGEYGNYIHADNAAKDYLDDLLNRGKAEVWTVDLTPKMKDEIMEGQPMFLRQSNRQTFKEWIKDSVVKEPVYHVSKVAGFGGKFKLFSHFGSQKAARDRFRRIQEIDANTYKVFLNIKKPIEIHDDTLLENAKDLAMALSKSKSDKKILTMNQLNEIYYSSEKRAEEILFQALDAKGYDGFVYKNRVEDMGSISYVPLRANQIKSAYNPAMVDENATLDPDNENIMYLGNRPEDEQLSNYEDVEQQIKDSYGLKTIGLMTKIKDWLQSVKDGFARHFEHLDTRKYGELADILRVYESTPERAKIKATELISKAIENLEKPEFNIFQRYIILKDMMSDIDKGLIGDGNLPFGFGTVEQVMADWDSIQTKITPKIQTALDTRYRMMESVRDALIDAGLLPETVRDNDSYYRHQVLAYMNLDDKYATKPGTSSSDIRKKKKGWMKSRTGSDLNYNTNYFEAEFEYIAQAIAQLETVKTLKRVRGLVDISDDLKAQAKEQREDTGDDTITWQSLIPEGYVKWQPEKGNSFYPVLTMPEDQVAALLDGDVLTPEEITIVEKLALGKKKLEWVIPAEVAETFDNFREFKDQNSLFAFYRHLIGTWKQWILLNPIRWIKYNLNNMSGDLDIVLGYNPKILKYGREAWKELWEYSKTGKMSADMKEAIEMNVVGSGISIAEIPDINKVGLFKDLAGGSENIIRKYVLDCYWNKAKGASNFRENWLRYASYKHFKSELAQGKPVYGASKQYEIDQLRNSKEKAAKLARELLGDYGNISHIG
ncbi:MAG: hypothetical protein C0602_00210 [Denitrovibrio sp.]|nr:MAG: hypothetical protein C0602_00210 [Denitrovibrio sp.]